MTMQQYRRLVPFFLGLPLVFLFPGLAFSAGGLHDLSVQLGTQLQVYWVIPFVCMLLSIAIGPLAETWLIKHRVL